MRWRENLPVSAMQRMEPRWRQGVWDARRFPFSSVGIERDALCVYALQGAIHPCNDLLGGLFLPRRHVHDAQPKFEIFAQASEALEVVGAGGREFHRQVLDLQAVELRQDRPIGSRV